jgi:hypothetical protein
MAACSMRRWKPLSFLGAPSASQHRPSILIVGDQSKYRVLAGRIELGQARWLLTDVAQHGHQSAGPSIGSLDSVLNVNASIIA